MNQNTSTFIDDSPGVKMEGDKYGFRVVLINPTDEEWVDKVIQAVNTFQSIF